jgi:hypothetical protein
MNNCNCGHPRDQHVIDGICQRLHCTCQGYQEEGDNNAS